ncbi:Gfo/Idh/MocA family protein [Phytohabitans flavus]|uniref:Gfo/Idh/MocA-like oxidoreductase N-terminal domain-containing protein n=1 Tax=Phytohabitans flavus TaxID=1076124 RepID=A0A6F8XQ30_9ACTN|nr:Gfo/Idh/MocA family oxidoreductase [Phytohabitans flavus]BCB75899.1 hypothetical protein Pflav_023090 [Phytohabitans flavus]
MAQRTYRIAIVGTGGIAGAHARAVRDSGRGRLVAAVDVDADRARAFAKEWDVPRVFASLDELLGAEELDLAHICSPPDRTRRWRRGASRPASPRWWKSRRSSRSTSSTS